MNTELIKLINLYADENLPSGSRMMCLMRFGAPIYGLDSVESDLDIRGVYVPFDEDGNASFKKTHRNFSTNPNEKNSNADVDVSLWSIGKFLDMYLKSNLVVMDMIHVPLDSENMVFCDDMWKYIRDNRHEFYSKELSKNKVYVRKQIDRYGVVGSKVKALNNVVDILEKSIFGSKNNKKTIAQIDQFFDKLLDLSKDNEHIKVYAGYADPSQLAFSVVNKSFGINTPIKQVLSSLRKQLTNTANDYHAANNNVYDKKAISHAVRALLQCRDIVDYGDVVLDNYVMTLNTLKHINLDFRNKVEPYIIDLEESVLNAIAQSNLKNKISTNFIDKIQQKITLYHKK